MDKRFHEELKSWTPVIKDDWTSVWWQTITGRWTEIVRQRKNVQENIWKQVSVP